jgi:hypothetical protein
MDEAVSLQQGRQFNAYLVEAFGHDRGIVREQSTDEDRARGQHDHRRQNELDGARDDVSIHGYRLQSLTCDGVGLAAPSGYDSLRLVATLAAELGAARAASSAQVSTLAPDRRPAQLRKLSTKEVRRPEQLVA